MKLYRIEYVCALDPGSPKWTKLVRAESARLARQNFTDPEDPDWEIVAVTQLKPKDYDIAKWSELKRKASSVDGCRRHSPCVTRF